MFGIFWLAALVFTPLAIDWQVAQQIKLNMPGTLPSTFIVVIATAIISTLMLLVGRSIRLGSNSLARLISRGPIAKWPNRVTRLGIAVLLVILGNLLVGGALGYVIVSYNSINADSSGQEPTNLGINSGSDASFAPWETLGREGRFFVGNTLDPEKIESVTNEPTQTPVRLYVGLQQGDTPAARTEVAVAELDRVDAWSREYLVLFGVTGTGWIDPNAINSLEVLTGGDLTTVAVQYSSAPSWIGFVADQQTTIDQNRSMIDGIVTAWREKPEGTRPKLVLFGQSLGAMGTQGAWEKSATPESVTQDFSSIAWIGPPAASTLWSTWQADRTGGPAWEPIIGNGEITRILISTNDPDGDELKAPPTIVFAAHANDPVVYWAPSLLLKKPAWLDQPLGPGVMPQMHWIPIITFLQVGMDLIAGGEPPEVGHNYSANMAQAVALSISPKGWSVEKTTALNASLPGWRYATG